MDNPKYRYWNYSSLPDNTRIFGGLLEYQAADDGQAAWDFDFAAGKHGATWRFAGFAYASRRTPFDVDDRAADTTSTFWKRTVCFAVPDYVIVLLLLVYPAIWIRRWRDAARRLKQGRCINCGYDLRGGHSVCPECGATVGAATSQK
jgi:hypothetical protein